MSFNHFKVLRAIGKGAFGKVRLTCVCLYGIHQDAHVHSKVHSFRIPFSIEYSHMDECSRNVVVMYKATGFFDCQVLDKYM